MVTAALKYLEPAYKGVQSLFRYKYSLFTVQVLKVCRTPDPTATACLYFISYRISMFERVEKGEKIQPSD